MRTVVHLQLDVDISGDLSKIPIHICSRKVAQLLCEHNIFLLTDLNPYIVVDKIIRKNRILYDK